LIDRNC